MKGHSGKDLGGYRKRGWWTLALWHYEASVLILSSKKSPNLLAVLLPLPDLSLKQCWRWMQPCAGKGMFPMALRPNKECIKFYETYFPNTLNLNDKGPSMKSVCSPKFYGPLTIWPWLKISPQSSLNVIYYLIISTWQWLMIFMYMPCIPMQIKPTKSLSRQGAGPALSFTERAAMSSLFLHGISVVCVNLSHLIHNAEDTVGQCTHQLLIALQYFFFTYSTIKN